MPHSRNMQNVLVEENELRFTFLDAYIFRRGYTKTPATPLTQNIPPPTATHPKSCPPTQNIPQPHLHPPTPQSTNKNCPPNPTQFQILITLL